jgi:catechol 2,3-dioxygenase-like lactoylglutathione lyase family enzyme
VCGPRAARLLAAIPMLAVADIAAGVDFYRRIGFAVLFQSGDYAALSRDDVHLHLWQCGDRSVADNTACRMRVAGIEALYAECEAAGIVHPNGALRGTDRGTREFTVLDPQGGAITFVEPVN